jgi:hypothetical protein
MVHEYIRAILLGQKAISFAVVEPFHSASNTISHFFLISIFSSCKILSNIDAIGRAISALQVLFLKPGQIKAASLS